VAIVVRPATLADLDAIVALDAVAFAHTPVVESIEAELSRSWSRVLVAVDPGASAGGGLAGFAVFWVVADEIHVLNVAVHPEHRRRGVGRALLDAMRGLTEEGASRVALLEVRVSNEAAIALYRSAGFERDGVRSRYYDDGEDAQLMSLRLSDAPSR